MSTRIEPWDPQPGDEASIINASWRGSTIEDVVVERSLKRDVVLDTGERFTKPDLVRRSTGRWDGRYTLVPRHSEQAVRVRTKVEYEEWQRKIRRVGDLIVEHAGGDIQPGWEGEIRKLAMILNSLLDNKPKEPS